MPSARASDFRRVATDWDLRGPDKQEATNAGIILTADRSPFRFMEAARLERLFITRSWISLVLALKNFDGLNRFYLPIDHGTASYTCLTRYNFYA